VDDDRFYSAVAIAVFATALLILALREPFAERLKLWPFVLLAVIGVAIGALSARVSGLADSMLEARFAQTKSALATLRRQFPDHPAMARDQTIYDEGLIAPQLYRNLADGVENDRAGAVADE
jgi:hypothetical protein